MDMVNFASTAINQKSPYELFRRWYDDVKKSGIKEPAAVSLATSTKCGAPSCRMVLLKDFDERGFVFYTNLQSRKSQHLIENPQAALCFFWPELNRQVRVEGYVQNVSEQEADSYFDSRPLQSRIGAWASLQSEPMENSGDLARRVAQYSAKWAVGGIKRPPFWSGYRIIPDYIEFWQQIDLQTPERLAFVNLDNEWKLKQFATPNDEFKILNS